MLDRREDVAFEIILADVSKVKENNTINGIVNKRIIEYIKGRWRQDKKSGISASNIIGDDVTCDIKSVMCDIVGPFRVISEGLHCVAAASPLVIALCGPETVTFKGQTLVSVCA